MKLEEINLYASIAASIATMLGTIVAVLALIICIRQSKYQSRILQYAKRKELYDFVYGLRDKWEFHFERLPKVPIYVPLNFFAFDTLSTYIDKKLSDYTQEEKSELVFTLTDSYNCLIDNLDDIQLYYNLKNNSIEIQKLREKFIALYSNILIFFNGSMEISPETIESNEMLEIKSIVKSINDELLSDNFEKLLYKMKEELQIK